MKTFIPLIGAMVMGLSPLMASGVIGFKATANANASAETSSGKNKSTTAAPAEEQDTSHFGIAAGVLYAWTQISGAAPMASQESDGSSTGSLVYPTHNRGAWGVSIEGQLEWNDMPALVGEWTWIAKKTQKPYNLTQSTNTGDIFTNGFTSDSDDNALTALTTYAKQLDVNMFFAGFKETIIRKDHMIVEFHTGATGVYFKHKQTVLSSNGADRELTVTSNSSNTGLYAGVAAVMEDFLVDNLSIYGRADLQGMASQLKTTTSDSDDEFVFKSTLNDYDTGIRLQAGLCYGKNFDALTQQVIFGISYIIHQVNAAVVVQPMMSASNWGYQAVQLDVGMNF